MKIVKEGLIKDTYELIIKEIQTVISISYLAMVGIGMLFNYQKYDEFSINIFDYADIFDFLIAPFEDMTILGFTLLSIVFPLLVFQFEKFWKRQFPKFYSIANLRLDRKAWFTQFRFFCFAVVMVFYLYVSSDVYGDWASKKIEAKSTVELKYSDNEIVQGIMIGKTSEVVFLKTGEEIKVIPITTLVKEIKIR